MDQGGPKRRNTHDDSSPFEERPGEEREVAGPATSASAMHLPGPRAQSQGPGRGEALNGLEGSKTQREGSSLGTAPLGMQQPQKQQQQLQQLQQQQDLGLYSVGEDFSLLEESIASLNRSPATLGNSRMGFHQLDLFHIKTEDISSMDKDRLDAGLSFGGHKDSYGGDRLSADNTLDILRDLDLPGSLSDLNEFYGDNEAAFLSTLSVDDSLLEAKPPGGGGGSVGSCDKGDGADPRRGQAVLSAPVIKTEKDADDSLLQLCTPGVIKQESQDNRSYCQVSGMGLAGPSGGLGPPGGGGGGSLGGPGYGYGANPGSAALGLQQPDQKPLFGLYPPLSSVGNGWSRGNGYGESMGLQREAEGASASAAFPVIYGR